MDYVRLGRSGLKISRLCLGTMNMGAPQWKPWIFDADQSRPIIKHAFDNGINFIDLADFYSTGVGEEVVGRIIADLVPREDVILTTKVGYAMGHAPHHRGHSRKHVLAAIDASLKRLHTDYVDVYMLHFFDSETPIEETMSAMNDIVKAGKARYIGVSTMTTWQFAKIQWVCQRHGYEMPINMQLQLNCAYREEEREMIPFCLDQGVGVTVFSPLARGLLSGDAGSSRNQTDDFTHSMYGDNTSAEIAQSVAKVANARGMQPAQIAQAWVLNRPGVSSMLVGVDNPAQLDAAIAALGINFDDDERYELDRNYTPCDVIRDDTAGTRIPRERRAAIGRFAQEMLETV